SPEPMKTRPPTIAADDFTGPPVLKLQSSDNLSGRIPAATPVSAGLPRNIGQSAPLDAALPASSFSDASAARTATRKVVVAFRIQLVGCRKFMCQLICQYAGCCYD